MKRKYRNCILTIGIFDGVHLGHQRIIKDVVRRAKDQKKRSVVLTFHPHPVDFFGLNGVSLTTLSEKKELIEKLGTDAFVVLEFTRNFSKLSPVEFVKKYILPILPSEIYVGSNHTFGSGAKGDVKLLKILGRKYGFKVHSVSLLKQGSTNLNSTFIRKLIACGKVDRAKAFLGRDYFICGKVVKGKGIGRNLGFPTANLKVEYSRLLPKSGVYIGRAFLGKKLHKALINVGFAPTFGGVKKPLIEVYIDNFHKNIYGKCLKVLFMKKLRNEIRFKSAAALTKQIKKDVIKLKEE